MKNRYSIATYIVLGLALIGIATKALQLIIPIAVFGVIFLLYKYPPNRWRKPNFASRSAKPGGGRTKERRTRNGSFRVIDGNKGSTDEPPKYH